MPDTLIRHAVDNSYELVAPGIFVRDLAISNATNGRYTLQVVHLEPEGARVEALHRHDEAFSLAYVLRGWLEVEFQQIGVHRLGVGTVVPAFNGPLHRERDCGGEFELLLLVTRQSMHDSDQQHIVVQQPLDAPYRPDTQDGYVYRDFELAAVTSGRMAAHTARAYADHLTPARWGGDEQRYHLAYVTEGWIEIDDPEHGRVHLATGSVICLPPGARCAQLARSTDALVVEIFAPAA